MAPSRTSVVRSPEVVDEDMLITRLAAHTDLVGAVDRLADHKEFPGAPDGGGHLLLVGAEDVALGVHPEAGGGGGAHAKR